MQGKRAGRVQTSGQNKVAGPLSGISGEKEDLIQDKMMEIIFLSLNSSQVFPFLFLFFVLYFSVLFSVCLFYFVTGLAGSFCTPLTSRILIRSSSPMAIFPNEFKTD